MICLQATHCAHQLAGNELFEFGVPQVQTDGDNVAGGGGEDSGHWLSPNWASDRN